MASTNRSSQEDADQSARSGEGLDGLRERYTDPSSPQQAGFHEGFADIIALLSMLSAQSVVAKVVRDRLMARLALRHPGYGWEHNAGYATADHRAGMQALGVTPHHRRSFITTKRILEGEQTSFDLFADALPETIAIPIDVSGASLLEVPVPA